MLTRRLQPFSGKPGQASAPIGRLLNDHANQCATLVLDRCEVGNAKHAVSIHDKAIVEAFPSSFLGVMINDPKALNARRATGRIPSSSTSPAMRCFIGSSNIASQVGLWWCTRIPSRTTMIVRASSVR
jgi:hypothetical protein